MGHDAEYDAEWDHALFTAPVPVIRRDQSSLDDDNDWEARYNEDTTGYVSDPLTTSFTDLDLGPALLKLGDTAGRADLESWTDD
jgi:hypothetical protein